VTQRGVNFVANNFRECFLPHPVSIMHLYDISQARGSAAL